MLWSKRFGEAAVAGLEHGAERRASVRRTGEALVKAMRSKSRDTAHGSCRTFAKHSGVTHVTVARIWDSPGLPPTWCGTCSGRGTAHSWRSSPSWRLYLNPPNKVSVLWVEERSHIQALDPTQPGLRRKPGPYTTLRQDPVREGTTSRFAALNVREGTGMGDRFDRRGHEDL